MGGKSFAAKKRFVWNHQRWIFRWSLLNQRYELCKTLEKKREIPFHDSLDEKVILPDPTFYKSQFKL